MVRALLAGKKTQTRRLAKFVPREDGINLLFSGLWASHYITGAPEHGWCLYLYRGGCWHAVTHPLSVWTPGTRLWVREAAFHGSRGLTYSADDPRCQPGEPPRRSPRFMPRAWSRITLTITDVRVQRLQEITESDAIAEGVEMLPEPEFGGWYGASAALVEAIGNDPKNPPARIRFAWLWNRLNDRAGRRWADNPWTIAISFNSVLRNIDVTPVAPVSADEVSA